MSNNKKMVFISHINEEKEIALQFQKLVNNAFIGLFDTFVSSSPEAISMGSRWLTKVSDALNSCHIAIIICSPESVKRPWINFEAGATWIRNIDVIPLCHSGMTPATLPVPLSELQGAVATDPSSIRLVLSALSSTLGSQQPSTDVVSFTNFMVDYEKEYSFKKELRSAINTIIEIEPQIKNAFKAKKAIQILVPIDRQGEINKHFDFLERHGFASLEGITAMMPTQKGMASLYQLTPLKGLEF
ncbi:toll/interleukin-1 receptor domain-containing protein [Klebsiella michiganensis]|uniref:toll/interleukin-1 receptor domain-containing protein n=1 Tax=Klebsiella michiganensis TaxID=1134687 RepID=UPI0022597533|nr:toll/interleukin-1 receptor domain-containing protein [Klebsiella michiganensis]MCX3081333.1 toll/interleukin-1 receptor domain-containing protein [Klebsiella michiganensis]MCY0818130.1 toll/interleukin-1 receptor domain-containing protein [Klebsiella michiganensis]